MPTCVSMCLHVYLITFQTYTGLKRQFHLHVRMTPLTFPECSVQCQSLSPCVMPCHAAPVSGAFGGNILVRRCLVYAADMGLCLAQPSRTRQKLPRPRERESGVWSRNSDRSCRAQLHNIRPAVGSCHKEKITGRVQTTGPGEAWPRLSSVGIMAPNLT